MGNEKITANMTIMDMIVVMSEGNPGAISVIAQMMQDPHSILDIILCDSLDIRGSKLYMLYNDCCGRNIAVFNRTLKMLRAGIFTMEQIHSNLELIRAIPFIDDTIIIEGVPSYEETFGPGNEKWEEYCRKNKESFEARLSEALSMKL